MRNWKLIIFFHLMFKESFDKLLSSFTLIANQIS